MTVTQLRDTMPAGEYHDWRRYYNQEPFGFPRDEFRFSVLAANTLLPASNFRVKDRRKLSPAGWYYRHKPQLTDEEQLQALKAQIPESMRVKRRQVVDFGD